MATLVDQQISLPDDLTGLNLSHEIDMVPPEVIQNLVLDLVNSPEIEDILQTNYQNENFRLNNHVSSNNSDWLSQYNYTPDTQISHIINRRYGGSYQPPSSAMYGNNSQYNTYSVNQGFNNQNNGTYGQGSFGYNFPNNSTSFNRFNNTNSGSNLHQQVDVRLSMTTNQQQQYIKKGRKRKFSETNFNCQSNTISPGNNVQGILKSLLQSDRST